MATIFSDGFESGDFSAWTGTGTTGSGTISVISQPYKGAYNAEIFNNDYGNKAYVYSFINKTTAYFRCYVAFDKALLNGRIIDLMLLSNKINDWKQKTKVILESNASGIFFGVSFISQSSGTETRVLEATPSNPDINTWYCVELFVDQTTGTGTLWLNGVQKVHVTGVADIASCKYAIIGNQLNCSDVINVYYDSVVVADSYIGLSPLTLFRDGFESGDFSAWTGTNVNSTTVTVQSTIKHHGSYAAQITGLDNAGAYGIAYTTVAGRPTELYERAYVMFDNDLAVGTQIGSLLHLETAGSFRVNLLRQAGGLYQWIGATPSESYSSATFADLRTDEWYYLELHGKIGDGDGVLEVWVDDTKVVEQTGLVTGGTYFVQFRVEAWNNIGNSAVGTIWYDCVAVSDGYIGTEVSNRLLMGVGLGCVSSP